MWPADPVGRHRRCPGDVRQSALRPIRGDPWRRSPRWPAAWPGHRPAPRAARAAHRVDELRRGAMERSHHHLSLLERFAQRSDTWTKSTSTRVGSRRPLAWNCMSRSHALLQGVRGAVADADLWRSSTMNAVSGIARPGYSSSWPSRPLAVLVRAPSRAAPIEQIDVRRVLEAPTCSGSACQGEVAASSGFRPSCIRERPPKRQVHRQG